MSAVPPIIDSLFSPTPSPLTQLMRDPLKQTSSPSCAETSATIVHVVDGSGCFAAPSPTKPLTAPDATPPKREVPPPHFETEQPQSTPPLRSSSLAIPFPPQPTPLPTFSPPLRRPPHVFSPIQEVMNELKQCTPDSPEEKELLQTTCLVKRFQSRLFPSGRPALPQGTWTASLDRFPSEDQVDKAHASI